ncbi:tRNA N(3)-methylcytidine methyltransferase METTL6 isoform X3 [Planococcus citri]
MDETFVESKLTDLSLSEIDLSTLKHQESRLVSNFKAQQIEKDCKKHWDIFYKRNENRFFKDRHWTTREFKELIDARDKQIKQTLLEVGCGTGNFIYPLLTEEKSSFFIYACDFSPRAVELVKSNPLYDESLVKAFVCDVTTEELKKHVDNLDIITLIFVLSAIHPDHFDNVVRTLYSVLKPGGVVLFRDYGLYDMTQLRFKAGHKISDNFYMRQDGTRTYFFSVDLVRDLFCRNGFSEIETSYVRRRTVNKKEGIDVPRIFVQAKYKKL